MKVTLTERHERDQAVSSVNTGGECPGRGNSRGKKPKFLNVPEHMVSINICWIIQ